MDRVHRVTKSLTWLKQLTTHTLYAKPYVRQQGGFKRLLLDKLMLLLFNHIQIQWRKLIWPVLLSISEHRPCCCCWIVSVVSDSVRPHRRQPTWFPDPWDCPGRNTGVGCHFRLQWMKVKSESEVVQSCPTLSDPMDCSLPGSSIHGIVQARVLEWVAIAFSDRPCRYPHESNELGARLGLVCPLRGFGSQSQCLQIPLFPDNLHLPRIQMITFAISPVLSCNSQSYVHPIFTFNMHRGRYQRWTLCHMHRV